MRGKTQAYPVLSTLCALALLAYLYLWTQADLRQFYEVPAEWFLSPLPEVLLLGFAVLLVAELGLFQRRRRLQLAEVRRMQQQIEELLANKKQLHAKAHVYANHADKLKLFISDKLLEYIEYDEKFLHFKSIASEVRHNGVISYDKVSTVLEQQLDRLDEHDSEGYARCCEARDSLRYLWDLLDLSTADNIALHIANQVCESEELLFQSELSSDELSAFSELPVFDSTNTLEKALARCFGTQPERLPGGRLRVDGHDLLRIQTHPTDLLLGNENHIILVLENVIGNAQYFAGRRGSRRSEKRAAIAIELDQRGDYIRYRIYNRGDTIDEETAAKLFQLGFSTRRARQHHGKGLGLYFVNDIVKGYEGQVSFKNVVNAADVLSLRLEMADGNVVTDVIELVLQEDDEPQCRHAGDEAAAENLQWEVAGRLESIEITHRSDQRTHRFAGEAIGQETLYDPSMPATPRWSLQLASQRKQTTLTFTPLDITGVRFSITLPSLNARREGNLLNADEGDMDRQVADISNQFKAFDV